MDETIPESCNKESGSQGPGATPFVYLVCGLTLGSEFPLDGLMPGSLQADVMICLGKAPERLEKPILDTPEYQSSRGELLLHVNGLASFYVLEGYRVIVDTCGKPVSGDIQLHILGTVLGALLLQRGLIPLHGSAVNINGRGVLFVGESGAGKSTLTRALCSRGYSFLTDDIAAIKVSGERQPIVFPGYPQQKLWQDTLDRMDVNASESLLVRVFNTMKKFSVPASELFFQKPLPIDRIYEIKTWPGKTLELEPVRGAAKAGLIMQNTYRAFLVNGMDVGRHYFDQCIDLAQSVRLYRLSRPENSFSVDDMVEKILGPYV
ncbi:MAG: hypothetical protein V1793_19720 [Pseudomonadota bacterium]